MIDYNWLVLAHLLLFVYWLGGDLGVFYSSLFVTDASLGNEGRATAGRILHMLDLVPRVCLILILPVGVSMASARWGLGLGPGALAALWVASLVWLAMAVTVFLRGGTPLTVRLLPLDLAVRMVVIAACVGVALWSLGGGGPLAEQFWLAAKFGLFGLLVACGVAIRYAARPFGPAFRRVMEEGSTAELEHTLGSAMGRARPFVLLIWAGLIASAALGVFKPAL